MLRKFIRMGIGRGGASYQMYRDRLLSVAGSDIVALYPHDDLTGFSAVDIALARNATYRNDGANLIGLVLGQQGIGDGKTAVLFNGAGSITIPEAVRLAFNGQEFTIFQWLKLASSEVWSDGTEDRFFLFTADTNNQVTARKSTAGGIDYIYKAGGTTKIISMTAGQTTADWIMVATTVSKTADQLIGYFNGSSVGAAVTGLGTWEGALASGFLGAQNASGSTPFNGSMAYTVIINRALTAEEVAAIDSPFDGAVLSPILFYGDSKTYGTGDDNPPADGANGYPPILLAYLGSTWREIPARIARPGGTVATMKAEIDADLTTFYSDAKEILINLGANDINPLAEPLVAEAWQADLAYILDAMHVRFPNAKIRVARIWRRYNNGQMTDLNDTWIPAVLSTRSPFVSLGIDERQILPGSDDGATYTTDGIHPNRAGYTAEAQAWLQLIGT